MRDLNVEEFQAGVQKDEHLNMSESEGAGIQRGGIWTSDDLGLRRAVKGHLIWRSQFMKVPYLET